MLNFDYHYGTEADLYAFYRVPKLLVKHAEFKNMSGDAKLLYGLMLDRLSLSLKNGWRDEKSRVYIYYTIEDVQEDFNCAHGKAVKLMSELDGIGLINRVKQGQGRPAKIYVKKFISPDAYIESCGGNAVSRNGEPQTSDIRKSEDSVKETPGFSDFRKREPQASDIVKSILPIDETSESPDFRKDEVQTSGFEKSGMPKNGSADFRKTARNYNDFSNTNVSKLEVSQSRPSEHRLRAETSADEQNTDNTNDTAQRIEAYTEIIKGNISYENLAYTRQDDIQLINDFISIMVDVILTPGKYVRINGEDKPRELVKSCFLKIGGEEMEHTIDQFRGVTSRIQKKKQYIVTLLYNCKLEMDSHYTNLVNHNMYG